MSKTRKPSPDPFVAVIVILAGDTFGWFLYSGGDFHFWQGGNKIRSEFLIFHVLSLLLRGENLGVIVKMSGFKDVWFLQDPSL